MTAGLLGGFGDPAADQKMADQYGVTPEMLSAQRYSSLGNIGAILLAAAQPGPIGQRGQILAQLSGVSGDAARGLSQMTQARMNGLKLKEAQDDLTRKAQVRDMVSKMDLKPEEKAWAIANPDQFLQARGQSSLATQQAVATQQALAPGQQDMARFQSGLSVQQAKDQQAALAPGAIDQAGKLAAVQQSAPFEAKVQQLIQSGVPEDKARGIASGRYVLKDSEDLDGNKTPTLYDIATGQPVGGAPQRAPLSPEQQKIMPSITPTTAGGKPVAYDEGTGAMGAIKSGVNTIASNLTGKPVFPTADKAIDDITKLNARTVGALSAGIAGRTTNQVRDMMAPTQVEPGSFFMPDGRAYERAVGTKQLIDRDIATLEQQLSGPGLTRADRSKAKLNLDTLRGVSADWGVVIANFGDKKPAAQPPAVGGTGGPGQGGPQFKILGVRDR